MWCGKAKILDIPYTQKVFISINFHHFLYLRQLILKVANFTKFSYML